MRNNYSAADHDPGDEDPTEHVKRALIELIGDELPDPRAAAVVIRERLGLPDIPTLHRSSIVERVFEDYRRTREPN